MIHSGPLREGTTGPYHPYSFFQRRSDRERAVVIANYDEREIRTVSLTLAGSGVLKGYRTVDDEEWRSLDRQIRLDPQSAAVVLEE